MAEEIIDTNPDIFPVGEYEFTVNQILKKKNDKGTIFYIFEMEAVVDGEIRKHKEFRMPWKSGDLILALGGKVTEKPGVFTFDREEAKGKKIKASIVHEPDYKDASKTRARIVDPTEWIPF